MGRPRVFLRSRVGCLGCSVPLTLVLAAGAAFVALALG